MPTAAQMLGELTVRCAVQVRDVGLFLDSVQDGMTPATTTLVFHQGLRSGLVAVSMFASADPVFVLDADLANVTPFARQRVLDEAERFVLRRVLLNWFRAERDSGRPAMQATVDARSGYLDTEKRSIQARVAELNEACAAVFREPAGSIVVNEREPQPPVGWRSLGSNIYGWDAYPRGGYP